ncbi:MAG TPA: Gfo/Idh/MocA family oxidoreductase [Verrucomicrobiales bacterium]|nr:Gfo/Idh/MocA family oxidoreductase [Verrucomicrobiales bacterium]
MTDSLQTAPFSAPSAAEAVPQVAVLGAGAWGRHLVRAFDDLGALAGVCDASTHVAEEIRRSHPSIDLWADLEEVLASDVAAVAVATPVPTHYAMARACLEAGKHVFVEKPLALRAADAEDLVERAERSGRVLMAGHLLLYQPAIRWIKQAIDEGRLGRLFSLHQERTKLGRARAVENALWSLGVHDVAVLLYLIGAEPETAWACGHRGLQAGVEDDVYLHLRFPGGIQAHLHNSWLWPENRRRLTVIGEAGMLVYDESSQTVALHQKRIDPDLRNVDGGEEIVFQGSADPLRLELAHFLECISNRARPLSDGRAGLAVVRVLESVFPIQDPGEADQRDHAATQSPGKRAELGQELD